MSIRKKKVAILHLINTRSVMRGPDFFYPIFLKEYLQYPSTKFSLYLVLRTDSKDRLQQRLIEMGLPTENLIFLESVNNRFKKIIEWLQFLRVIIQYRFSIWMICSFRSPEEELFQVKTLRSITRMSGSKLIFVNTYALLPQAFRHQDKYEFEKRDRVKYGAYFSAIRFDAIYTWYQSFADWAPTSTFFKYQPLIQVLESRFCDMQKFKPLEKKKWIVFASALESYKHPLTVVNAAATLVKLHPDRVAQWKFLIIGSGKLKDAVLAAIEMNQLKNHVELITGLSDISSIVNHSLCYVSAQEEENFPSLAMNECMAAGNAIIARDVGRTSLFVHHEKNGLLVHAHESDAIEKGILQFVLLPEEQQLDMGKKSRELCEKIHTPQNFIRQTESLWSAVCR
jgi:glycosyltransferase involved in cell wall biosynthesis